jgi:hypothetical protein
MASWLTISSVSPIGQSRGNLATHVTGECQGGRSTLTVELRKIREIR